MPRLHCPAPLAAGLELALPPGAARHAQVLRLQPGDTVTLFNGEGGEWDATVTRMGRSDVEVRVDAHLALEREAPRSVRLALGMPANERMDWLVEKAAELGATGIDPLMTERSVLRLAGERAAKKQAHWQAIAVAACEQCGRNRVPAIAPPQDFTRWCAALRHDGPRLVLSLDADTRPLAQAAAGGGDVLLLSGPEGGLSAAEVQAAKAHGFVPVTLGPRVLRAETAPLAALVALTIGLA
ncbi:16S rRNA (uracil(1498)-N(3))-methyltransferase [Ramlibacter sp. MAHUQ-53]|uniref:16S rRNA (uracil(1498)-N(3))-methyltransferase n=1 Tax=unclassified Ramlibacter TaxID=2617605 RepID=UPI003644E1CD